MRLPLMYWYECDTCSETHLTEFQNEEDVREFKKVWESQGMKVWRARPVLND
jgi:hypothetical protein